MAARITAKQYKRVDLVEVDGRIDSSTAPQLEQVLQQIIKDGRYRIVVDLSDTVFMSSAGLRAFVSAHKQVRRFNRGDIRLAGLTDKVKKAFELSGLLELFNVYPNTVDAIGSF